MKTLHYCVRCHTLRFGERTFSEREEAALFLSTRLGICEVKIVNELCHKCRQGIGDESARDLFKRYGGEL